MFTATLGILALIFFPHFISTAPVPLSRDGDTASVKQSQQRRGFVLPLQRRKVEQRNVKELLAGSIGLGDFADIVYTVSAQIGNTTTALNLDTGSSDLWVMTGACQTTLCSKSTATAYSPSNFQPIGVDVNLTYGDSSSGTYAAGPVGLDTVTLAGLSLANQPFAAVNNTDNSAVSNGGAGIIGLGFPSESVIQTQVIQKQFNDPSTTDDFVSNIASYGPFVSRLVVDGIIDQPLFSVTLQRDTIDPSGNGRITVGELPSGVDNSSITWVPVRPYTPAEGGLNPPSFAADEVYPLRWEIPIDNVYLDGKQLPNSTIPRNGVSPSFSSALIDTGNSIIRGPQDVVSNILSTISPAYAANSDAKPILPCASSHTLAFQIGGEMFPVDPLDLISQNQTENASECVASSVVPTDPPSYGALFSWSLGDPFLKSNLVIFYYGNLTHPSVDPPRIGFLSMVPSNASSVLQEVVSEAVQHGGVFSCESSRLATCHGTIGGVYANVSQPKRKRHLHPVP
ncbi:uncharacterized protein FIBRA_05706 [Fibroporia radiculosa]|uniref:Peptidase A1 domain-containing protein n=1 Tax=Fibroporia radiculosa TaxID=599839 RepID=J4GRH0_9APHY|nr:uncharacterized protein FIBRA_05706 [Fibroporia radiculosa]CCM03570.1 predicted protein [Fibroporia radiculosa]